MAGNRWIGVALVGLLAWVAQPAAVVGAPLEAAQADREPRASECAPLAEAEGALDEPLVTETDAEEIVCEAEDAAEGLVEDVTETAPVEEPSLR